MKIQQVPSFADVVCDIRIRKVKAQFFNQMDTLIDWRLISNIINKHYTKGNSAVGTPSYDGLLLFKMCLLQTWYGLSDYEVEDRINDSISFSKFCGLTLEQVAPDHSTLSRFRTQMTNAKVYENLFKALNKQLEKHKIIVKSGAIVDASVIDTPLKPKGKLTHQVVEDRSEEIQEPSTEVKKEYADSRKLQVNGQGAHYRHFERFSRL